jgi:hypothetical protein
MLFNKSQHTKLCLLMPAFSLAVISKIDARIIKTISDPSITITASSKDACRNASITFTATVGNAGSDSKLQWKKNSVNAGSDSINYTDEFFPGDVVVCMLISGSGRYPVTRLHWKEALITRSL